MTLSSAIQLPANALTAFAFFIARGLTPAQSAGLVGNFMQESGMNPNSQNPNEGAIGIANWEGGRRSALQDYAASIGQPTNSLQAQLWFAWHELNTSESGSLQALKATSTPAAAASTVATNYERCGDCQTPTRIGYADAIFQGGTGQAPPPGSDVTATLTSSGPTPDDCQIGWNWPSAGPFGGGKICVWHAGWSRALLGGLCLAGGGVIVIAGIALLAGKDVTPAGAVMKMNQGFSDRRQRSVDMNKSIASGQTRFPDRPPKFAGRNLTTGRFIPKGTFE